MSTHVSVDSTLTTPIDTIPLNSDNIGYVESYDFSTANTSLEARIAAITTVASVCYANPKALGSISLYDRLATENKGLPSSSYEFVPVLLKREIISSLFSNCYKYGEWVEEGQYLLTNLRALIADVGDRADQFFNTPEECTIIARHFKVLKSKIDLATARQFMRHRASWQELSRRYVSGKRVEFEFYVSPKMHEYYGGLSARDHMQSCLEYYYAAIDDGVKPEEARRILPQAMYTTVWSAWQPNQLEVLFKLRCDSHAQSEIQELASAMKQLTKDNHAN